MRFKAIVLALLALAGPLAAAPDTETVTPTASPSPTETATFTASPTITVSPTPTPGPGSWTLSMASPLVSGIPGNSAIWSYTADQPWTAGQLYFSFPQGLDAPVGGLFYVKPSQAGKVTGYAVSGQAVSVSVQGVNQGEVLQFYYGYNSSGFMVASGSNSPLTDFYVRAHPQSQAELGGLVAPVLAPVIVVVTATATPTVTPTATITPTFSVTPTVTATFTITQTFTETAVGAAPVQGGLYCYPNPFDLRRYDKVTLRFNPTASAEVQIFNLVGEPVRRLDAADVYQDKGWAIWHGEDDHLRKVQGGLYFARIKTPEGVLVRKFTVLH